MLIAGGRLAGGSGAKTTNCALLDTNAPGGGQWTTTSSLQLPAADGSLGCAGCRAATVLRGQAVVLGGAPAAQSVCFDERAGGTAGFVPLPALPFAGGGCLERHCAVALGDNCVAVLGGLSAFVHRNSVLSMDLRAARSWT